MEYINKKSSEKNDVPENSSMAKNMEEVKELGREMDRMLTNKELKEEKDLDSDPKQ